MIGNSPLFRVQIFPFNYKPLKASQYTWFGILIPSEIPIWRFPKTRYPQIIHFHGIFQSFYGISTILWNPHIYISISFYIYLLYVYVYIYIYLIYIYMYILDPPPFLKDLFNDVTGSVFHVTSPDVSMPGRPSWCMAFNRASAGKSSR